MKITLLKPTWDKARTSKSYYLVKTPKGTEARISNSYELGKWFNWGVVTVAGLKGYYDLLRKCQSARVFRISGQPIQGLDKSVRRKKDNFVDAGTTLLEIDADSWKVPKGYDLRTPENIHRTIKHMLCDVLGLDFLRDCSCVVLMSNSAWSYYDLRAHIYFQLSAPVELEFLHKWGYAFNSMGMAYTIDYSLFRSVQPDYISKRTCEKFADPLPDDLRLTLHCDNLSPCVDSAVLTEHFTKDISTAEAFADATGNNYSVVKKDDSSIGETWEETLKLCGSAQHGINDPAYRASAQMVQTVGNQTVEANLNYYIEKVFNLAWTAIVGHNVRNTKKERDYYDKARFRNYITTALQKNFGESTDNISKAITSAIKKVLGGANPTILFDNDMLESYRILKAKNPGQWATFRNVVKTKLKGKITITDIDQAMNTSKRGDIRVSLDKVIKSFDWVQGSIDKGLYCKKKKKNGYNLIGIDSIESDIYTKALDLFDDAVPHNFEKNVMKVLASRSRDESTSPFVKAAVENRCHTITESEKNILYFNCGTNDQGDMTTCVVKEDSVELIPSSKAPVIWSTDVQIGECDIDDPNGVAWDKSINSFMKDFRLFVTAEDGESMIDIISWMVAAVVNQGTAPLLELSGASGDGKSTTAVFIKELIDPTSSHIREGQDLHNGIYKKEDLAKVLRARHVTIFDNLSNLKPYTQDLLCSIATGWKYDLRLMYTQQYLSLNIKKPIILTSLAPIITNQDLRSRSISVNVSKKKKMGNGDIYTLWDKKNSSMRLGFFCLVSKVLKRINDKRGNRDNLNDRDLWVTNARAVVMKTINYGSDKDIVNAIAKRKVDRDIQEALTSSASAHVIAWILADVTTFNGANVKMSTSELFIIFKQFLNENAGEKIIAHGIPIEITMKNIPQSSRGFGILLSKIKNDIYSATGWDMESIKSGGYRKRLFIKDPNYSLVTGV